MTRWINVTLYVVLPINQGSTHILSCNVYHLRSARHAFSELEPSSPSLPHSRLSAQALCLRVVAWWLFTGGRWGWAISSKLINHWMETLNLFHRCRGMLPCRCSFLPHSGASSFPFCLLILALSAPKLGPILPFRSAWGASLSLRLPRRRFCRLP